MKRVKAHGLIFPGDVVYVPCTNLILSVTRKLSLAGRYTTAGTANAMKNNGVIIYKFDI
jgi:hypothetical protein